MAEVLSKAGIFTSCSSSGDMNHHRHQNRTGVCDFSIKSANFSSTLCFPALKLQCMHESSSGSSPRFDFYGPSVSLRGHLGIAEFNPRNPKSANFTAQMSIGIKKVQKWWEKGLQPNLKEMTGARDLVDSLLNAGDKLVVVDFFSPGCGGCRALHPKFLQVNYEEHKSMCYSLNVHVLPFFRFYRGAEGRVCSFSCTNATIKKFKDALSKYGTDRCSLAPAKGLEEKELLALAANKELPFEYTPKIEERVPVAAQAIQEEIAMETSKTSSSLVNTQHPLPLPLPLISTSEKSEQNSKSEALATYN